MVSTLPDPDTVTIPDHPTTLSAWRLWRVQGADRHSRYWLQAHMLYDDELRRRRYANPGPTPVDLRILSYRQHVVWPVGETLQATCRQPELRRWEPESSRRWPCATTPSRTGEGHEGAGCGISAYRTIEELLAPEHLGLLIGGSGRGEHYLAGEVRLWGLVTPHDNGWRAQYGRIARLVVPEGFPEDHQAAVAEAARCYGVPFEVLGDR